MGNARNNHVIHESSGVGPSGSPARCRERLAGTRRPRLGPVACSALVLGLSACAGQGVTHTGFLPAYEDRRGRLTPCGGDRRRKLTP